jgi:hypothetical protein
LGVVDHAKVEHHSKLKFCEGVLDEDDAEVGKIVTHEGVELKAVLEDHVGVALETSDGTYHLEKFLVTRVVMCVDQQKTPLRQIRRHLTCLPATALPENDHPTIQK